MTRRQRAVAAIGTIAIAVGGLAYATGAGPFSTEAIDVCVTSYESPNLGGDSLAVCSTSPLNVHIANLSTHTEGLNNGCQRVSNTSSSWNDCISSASIGALPSNQSVHFYRDSSYGTQVYCTQTDGSSSFNMPGGANDLISSFRILGGNC